MTKFKVNFQTARTQKQSQTRSESREPRAQDPRRLAREDLQVELLADVPSVATDGFTGVAVSLAANQEALTMGSWLISQGVAANWSSWQVWPARQPSQD